MGRYDTACGYGTSSQVMLPGFTSAGVGGGAAAWAKASLGISAMTVSINRNFIESLRWGILHVTGYQLRATSYWLPAMRYRCVRLRMKMEPCATAIEASVAPSSSLTASFWKVVPGAITVATPSSLRK